MGRRGKKKSSAAAAAAAPLEQEVGESAVDSASQPQPRKRGRPKKIVVEKAEETHEEAEEKVDEEEEVTGKEARAEKGKERDPDDVLYSKTKPKVVKREGTSRRKSEPRRAAE